MAAMVDLAAVPELPASAMASLTQFEELIETYAQHRLPRAYLGFVILYAVLHTVIFLLTVPIFAKQIKSGRFWLFRLVSTPRGRILVPNHLDCSATLIGAYTIYDVGYFIKLILCFYNLTGQHSLPALLLLRFIILTTIGWIFLIGFFLVRVPPSSFVVPAVIWNVGIFAAPLSIHFGALFLLVKATNHWNSFWAQYEFLSASIQQARANGVTLPSTMQIRIARQMLGVDLSRYAYTTRNWAFVYYAWTALFATAILVVTLNILQVHWAQLSAGEGMPMQMRRTRTLHKTFDRTTSKSLTASGGVRRWLKGVPQPLHGDDETETRRLSASSPSEVSTPGHRSFGDGGGGGKRSDTDGSTLQGGGGGGAPSSKGSKQHRHGRPTGRRLVVYLLGLKPLTKDAYDDPTRHFSEREARAGLRSLLLHTALQGAAIFMIALAQVSAVFIVTQRAFLQPLLGADAGAGAGGFGAEYVRLGAILKMVEAWGTALPGMVLVGSILVRQMKAIALSQARANQGVAEGATGAAAIMGVGTGALQLSEPGPSASARWSLGGSTRLHVHVLGGGLSNSEIEMGDKSELDGHGDERRGRSPGAYEPEPEPEPVLFYRVSAAEAMGGSALAGSGGGGWDSSRATLAPTLPAPAGDDRTSRSRPVAGVEGRRAAAGRTRSMSVLDDDSVVEDGR